MSNFVFGELALVPALERPDLLAPSVARALKSNRIEALVAPIDQRLATDADEFFAAYDVPLEVTASTVVVRLRTGEQKQHLVCVAPVGRELDTHLTVRGRTGAETVQAAPEKFIVKKTGMDVTAISPFGAPREWSIWIDSTIAGCAWVCLDTGVAGAKMFVTGNTMLQLPMAERVRHLARPAALVH